MSAEAESQEITLESRLDSELFKALILSDPHVLEEGCDMLLENRLAPELCASVVESLKFGEHGFEHENECARPVLRGDANIGTRRRGSQNALGQKGAQG
eukprot:868911-Rhodomonas_salina.1